MLRTMDGWGTFSTLVEIIADAMCSPVPFRLVCAGLVVDLHISALDASDRAKHVTEFFVAISRMVRLAQFELRIKFEHGVVSVGVDRVDTRVVWIPATLVGVAPVAAMSVDIPDRSGSTRKIIL